MQRIQMIALAALASLAVATGVSATEVDRKDNVVVNTPTTDVEVSSDKVTVTAPFTDVEVDKDDRRVRIRVPYFSGDISW
jgi:hypothetical protein